MTKVVSFWKQLNNWLKQSGAPPLLLIGNVESSWQETLNKIKCLAVCREPAGPCLKCRDCRQAESGRHADIVSLTGEGKAYSVKQVRQLISQLATTSFSGHRLVIIEQAEKLPAVAANTLLKELEDSSRTNHWLLTTSYKGRLLPTIISRCQLLLMPADLERDHTVLPSDMTTDESADKLRQLINQSVPLDNEALVFIVRYLLATIRAGHDTPATRRALLRLRDYHRISSLLGNTKLASDVLLASLAQLTNNLSRQNHYDRPRV